MSVIQLVRIFNLIGSEQSALNSGEAAAVKMDDSMMDSLHPALSTEDLAPNLPVWDEKLNSAGPAKNRSRFIYKRNIICMHFHVAA